LGYNVYQLLPSERKNKLLDRISLPFQLSCIANIAWILFWHYEFFGTTLLIMLAPLASLIWLTRILFAAGPAGDAQERWLLCVPFSIYVGCITVATLANLTAVLEDKGLRPFDLGARDWAVGMVILGGLIACEVDRVRRDLAYLAAIFWAVTVIGVDQRARTHQRTAIPVGDREQRRTFPSLYWSHQTPRRGAPA
jgi:hypothetical protein